MEFRSILLEFLILLAVSIPVSFVFQKLKIPSIVGFLVTGMIVGPSGAGFVSEIETVKAIAELGVVLLLFTIGIEFSIKDLLASGSRVLMQGTLQVLFGIFFTTAIAHIFDVPVHLGIFLGFLFTLSSTAIVLKVLSDRAEVDAPHGRLSTGILLFQDLSVIPMMLLIPSLAGGQLELTALARQLLVAIFAVGVLIVTSRYVVPVLLKQVVQLRNRDVFLVTILFICLGTAYASGYMGLSLALGAFIAGLVISDSAYSHQILADVLPFRDIFNAIFFISVGMLVDVSGLVQSWKIPLTLTAAIVVGKAILLFTILMLTKSTFRVAWITALSLCQVGEFSFLIAQQGSGMNLLPNSIYQSFLSASVFSMLLTPFLILFATPSGLKLQQFFERSKLPGIPERTDKARKDHLLIIGFGLNGQNLSRVVLDVGIPFLVIELNDKLVQKAREQGIPVLFGDATRKEVIYKAQAHTSRMVVVAISDIAATRRCVAMIRELNSSAYVLVRTRYISEVDSLVQLGANFVIPEEFETSIEIFARVLHEYNIPEHLIEQQVQIVRSGSYAMLRGLSVSHERLLRISELLLKSTVEQVVLGSDSPAKDKTLGELDLRRKTGTSVIVVIRGDQAFPNPDASFLLKENDILVLWGAHEQLDRALKLLGVRGDD